MNVELYTIVVEKNGKKYRNYYISNGQKSMQIVPRFLKNQNGTVSYDAFRLREWASDKVYTDNEKKGE